MPKGPPPPKAQVRVGRSVTFDPSTSTSTCGDPISATTPPRRAFDTDRAASVHATAGRKVTLSGYRGSRPHGPEPGPSALSRRRGHGRRWLHERTAHAYRGRGHGRVHRFLLGRATGIPPAPRDRGPA